MNEQFIIAQDDILQSLTVKLSTLREGQGKYTGIVLWTPDVAVNEIIQKQEFRDKLGVELDNHDLRSYARDIRYSLQEPNGSVQKFQLDTQHGKVCVGLIRLLPRIIAKKGTFKESEYILDRTDQIQWNIGRGEQPADRYGVDINNFIIIKDDERNYETRNINEHVSSYHAKILYENGGFYLQAEEGGMNHTRLKRGKYESTLRTEIKMPLYDGDFIKLGSVNHYVLLLFKLS